MAAEQLDNPYYLILAAEARNGCYDLVVVNFDVVPGWCRGRCRGCLQNSTRARNGWLPLLMTSIMEIMT
jgi:hypothetical protein